MVGCTCKSRVSPALLQHPPPSVPVVLVSAPRLGRGAVGIKIELAFLGAVFHVAAGAIDLLAEKAGLVLFAGQQSNDKSRIGRTFGPLRLGDYPALSYIDLTRAFRQHPRLREGRLFGCLCVA
jgi:hypothetical protein